MNSLIKTVYFLLNGLFRKKTSRKVSYSQGGIDLLLNHIFRNKNDGIYIDVGCNHPIKNNNTYILHKKGWSGINIDLDKSSIEQFMIYRPNDANINSCVSKEHGLADLYYYHEKSPVNTINKNVSIHHKNKHREVIPIKTVTLNSVIEDSKFKNHKIDLLSIDVEGSELDVLKGFNLDKYRPDIIVVEFLDLKIKKLELVNQDVKTVLNSEIYKLLLKNNYHFVNFVHSDLVFASSVIRNF